ncbi:hypothetical protein [Spirochaeta isovalerica]|uniref:Uncharacterized protein n=1 Tax=Spirochaeta isovalerica TaxID=150 RepID=A0A841R3M8_9SPIO|nr:hypothetical protein [Spirochaeta isovalerica]MBB6478403.1 hypothetical protein [Spirochaeta isovalerica]
MITEQEKAKQFILKLLANPTLSDLSELQKEEQILQFLHINGNKLYPTLSSPAFFPGRNLMDISNILYTALFDITDSLLIPELRTIIYEKINYSFFAFLGAKALNEEGIRFQIFKFLEKNIKKPVIRRNLTGPHRAITTALPVKYLVPAFERRKYILFELTKVQRLRMAQSEIQNFIYLTMLLRPAIHLMEAPGRMGANKSNSGMVQTHYVQKVIEELKKELTLIPEEVICSGINSNLSFQDNNSLEATARMASLFASMGTNYRPAMKIDRGAVSADSSWFNIARKNYRFNGFDKDMLSELYNISVENGW